MKSFRSFQFAYTAEFDDYQDQYAIAGNTAVAPEPISSMLFLSGGAALIARRRFKVKR